MNIEEKMLELRNYASRYGDILEDSSWTSNGHNFRATKYRIDGKNLYVEMKDGQVAFMDCM